MSVYLYNTTTDLQGAPVTLETLDLVQIGAAGYVYTSISDRPFQTGATGLVDQLMFSIQGTLATPFEALRLGITPTGFGATVTHTSVHVAATGVVAGYNTMTIVGTDTSITNHGQILGTSAALYLGGTSTGTSRTTIYNDGLIAGQGAAIFLWQGNTESIRVENHGVIGMSSTISAFAAPNTTSDDWFRNAGVVLGNIEFGGGNDTYDGRGGEVVGIIRGEEGDDTFIPGDGEETFDGGLGVDWLDFRHTAQVQIALDGTFNATGPNDDDTYIAIEGIWGSRSGNDTLWGDEAANRLIGLGGNDVLYGQLGADRLDGGRGADTMTGGLGNDQFFYRSVSDGGDVITDFSAAAVGNDDRFLILATGFSLALPAGALAAVNLAIRADNAAQDANDFFVFRTTDKTLWFDADGNGGAAAMMLADLQASATLTAADIFIV